MKAIRRVCTLLATAALLDPALALAADTSGASNLPVSVAGCAVCHGSDGNSVGSGDTPRLAGQEAEYIKKQLQDFSNGSRRGCGTNTAEVVARSPRDRAEIASYFAAQSALINKPPSSSSAMGEKLYTRGSRSSGFVPACIGCHGPTGGGRSHWKQVMTSTPAILPATIGGQPSRYIAKQLYAFRSGSRKNDTGAVMRQIATRLSDDEVEAVSSYISELR